VLTDASRTGVSGDVARLFASLAVHVETGARPGDALRLAELELRRRVAVQRETRALIAQARLSGRMVMFGLTPLGLLALALFNPFGVRGSLFGPVGLIAGFLGLLIQGFGLFAIELIAGGPARRLAAPRPPVLRRWAGSGNNGQVAAQKLVRRVAAAMAPQTTPKWAIRNHVIYSSDLAGASLRAGASPRQAIEQCAPLVPGKTGEELRRVVAECRAGARMDHALDEAAARLDDADFRRFTDAFTRSASLGVPLEATLEAVAADARSRMYADSAEAARHASVWAMVPLTLVIVPGFLLMTLAPLLFAVLQQIAAIASQVGG
jgi:Flp pilus assembly protein TadB